MSRTVCEQIYTALMKGETYVFHYISKRSYESIRVNLYRYHRNMKAIGGTDDSILATYKDGEASFRLGSRSQQRIEHTFTIEVIPNAQVPGPLEQNSEERNSHDYLSQDG